MRDVLSTLVMTRIAIMSDKKAKIAIMVVATLIILAAAILVMIFVPTVTLKVLCNSMLAIAYLCGRWALEL